MGPWQIFKKWVITLFMAGWICRLHQWLLVLCFFMREDGVLTTFDDTTDCFTLTITPLPPVGLHSAHTYHLISKNKMVTIPSLFTSQTLLPSISFRYRNKNSVEIASFLAPLRHAVILRGYWHGIYQNRLPALAMGEALYYPFLSRSALL